MDCLMLVILLVTCGAYFVMIFIHAFKLMIYNLICLYVRMPPSGLPQQVSMPRSFHLHLSGSVLNADWDASL